MKDKDTFKIELIKLAIEILKHSGKEITTNNVIQVFKQLMLSTHLPIL